MYGGSHPSYGAGPPPMVVNAYAPSAYGASPAPSAPPHAVGSGGGNPESVPPPPRRKSSRSLSLRSLDFFPKVAEDFAARSATGGVVTLVAVVLMALLFLSELTHYLTPHTVSRLTVDNSRATKMAINFDITMHHLPCSWLSLDVMDVSGSTELDVHHDVWTRRLDPEGNAFTGAIDRRDVGPQHKVELLPEDGTAECGSCYGASDAESPCCNTCDDVREAYKSKHWSLPDPATVKQCHDESHREELLAQTDEGCHLWGTLHVGRVAGNFHIAPGKSYNGGPIGHAHDLSFFNVDHLSVEHTVHALSFGAPFPGQVNPLDGASVRGEAAQVPGGGKPAALQYFLKVVPTTHTRAASHAPAHGLAATTPTPSGVNETTWSSSYSVAEHVRTPLGDGIDPPGVFFYYDLSPIRVEAVTARPSFASFAAGAAAVVGGVWSLAGVVEAGVTGAAARTARKRDLGKLT